MYCSFGLAFWYGSRLVANNVGCDYHQGDCVSGGKIMATFFSVIMVGPTMKPPPCLPLSLSPCCPRDPVPNPLSVCLLVCVDPFSRVLWV